MSSNLKETDIGLIPEEWEVVKLGDFSDILTGFPFKSALFSDEGIKLVRGDNVTKGSLRWGNKTKYWNEMDSKLIKYCLESSDVLVSMDGSLVGKNFAQVKEQDLPLLLVQRVARIRSNDNINQNFIYFLISSFKFKDYVDLIKTGTSIPHISAKQIKGFEFALPSLEEQNTIAEILSSLEDKINLNQKMNQTLEEIGQAIFKYWFVHYEFPNEEGKPYKSSGGEMVDSDLGEIPDGWEVVSVNDAVELNPKLRVEREMDKIHVPMTGLSKNSMIITEFEMRKGSSGAKFQNQDTLFARITPSTEHGKTAFVQFLNSDEEIAIGSTEFIVMRSRTVNPYYVYCLARYEKLRKHAINSMTGTSGRQRVQNDCFNSFFIAQPDETILFKFEKLMKPIFQKIELMNKESQNLSIIRDSLLPKLISGKVRVIK